MKIKYEDFKNKKLSVPFRHNSVRRPGCLSINAIWGSCWSFLYCIKREKYSWGCALGAKEINFFLDKLDHITQ